MIIFNIYRKGLFISIKVYFFLLLQDMEFCSGIGIM